jgi:predicted nucleotidyltransferase
VTREFSSSRETQPIREALQYCAQATERIRHSVNDDLIGVYLHGSLALGDFNSNQSDIDLLAVTATELPAAVKARLCDVLSPSSLPCPAAGLELSLVARVSLELIDAAPIFEIHIATDTKAGTERCVDGAGRTGDSDLVMHYAVLRSRGVTLFGPAAGDVFPKVPRKRLLEAFRGELDWALKNASPSYQVLNAARAWRFVEDDTICSKSEGAEWARARQDPSVIDAALAHRRGQSGDHPDQARAAAFVKRVEQRLIPAAEGQGASPRLI